MRGRTLYSNMHILGLIPARGGSSGVPRKNVKLLNGVSLIGYTIAAGIAAERLDRVVVSTEDDEIAAIGKGFGADVPFLRPRDLATDESPTLDTVVHAVEYFQGVGEHFDAVCLLQPTVPFRTSADIDQAIDKFERTGADSLISVSEIPHTYNPHWAFIQDTNPDHLRIATGDESIIPRRQDLPRAFHRDGSIYITKSSVILDDRSIYGSTITYFENVGRRQINIDTEADWAKAEAYASNQVDDS
jgi:CMP-N,N'-diacetyllegionaminic acid synthase